MNRARNHSNVSDSLFIAITLLGISFIGFYLLMAWHNRPAGDDIMYIHKLYEFGWFNSWQNFSFNVRWSGYLLFDTIFIWGGDFATLRYNIFIFHIISLALAIYSFRALAVAVMGYLQLPKLSKLKSWAMGALITILCFFATSQHIEVWFWIIAMTVYLWGTLLAVLGTALLIESKSGIKTYLGLVLCFGFVGGTMEHFVLLLLFAFGLFVLWQIRKNGWVYLSSPLARKLLVAAVAMAVVFFLSIVGDGVTQRLEFEESFSTVVRSNHSSIHSFTHEISRLWHYFAQPKTLVFLLLLIPFVFWGKIWHTKSNVLAKLSRTKPLRFAIFTVVILAITCVFCFVPMYIIFGYLGPARAWLPIDLTILFLGITWAVYMGARLNVSTKLAAYTVTTSVIIGLSAISYYAIKQYPVVAHYSQAYDEQIESLSVIQSCYGQTVFVNPLPDSGTLIRLKISPDSSHILNRGYAYLVGIDCDVASVGEEPMVEDSSYY